MNIHNNVDLTGRQFAQYAVLSLIGAGGMGEVYWARDEKLRRDVAIKVVTGSRKGRPGRRALLTEARVLSRLDHPNVAHVYDFLTHGGTDCIVMELVPGATLGEVLKGGPLPYTEVVRLGGQLVRGLAAAHAANVIHQDIKPANLKVTSSGELKILDFGVARLLPGGLVLDTRDETTSGCGVFGTVPYMAPERLRGDESDERGDIFSTGAVLYEMAAGRRAFPEDQIVKLVESVVHHDPEPLTAVNPLVPPGLGRVVMKALEKLPADRQQSAEELARDLEELTTRASPSVPTSTHAGRWWAGLAG